MKKLFISLFFIFFTNQLLAIRPIDKQLLEAVHYDDLQLLDQALKNDANINAQDNNGNTPLILAVFHEHTEIAKLLLQSPGIDINAKNNDGFTALMWAAMIGCTEIAKLLLQSPGIDINAKNNDINTALEMAKRWDRNNNNIARLIIDSKHFDIDKFFESIPQYRHAGWLDYISEQQTIIAQEKWQKLVKKHCSIINYLQQREEGRYIQQYE